MKNLIRKLINKAERNSYFSVLKTIYHKTPAYNRLLKKQKELKSKEKSIIKKYLKNNFKIRYDPFSGIKYIKNSFGSVLLPKIIGSYEEPIQEWINQAIKRKYYKVIDLGSAEGYYAIGMAKNLPQSTVLASDIDPKARHLCRILARKNNCNNIKIVGKLDHQRLNKEIIRNKTIIICDIEGNELELLEPNKVKKLNFCDIICELHDDLVSNNITEEMIKRFHKTHSIEIVVDRPREKNRYKILNSLQTDIVSFILDERRYGISRWARLIKNNNKKTSKTSHI
ncbi:MAG: methyltransferase [Candidatus Woesebacteria bacterium]|nr:MAG: methyltransferase [Candidatus Woesebacteria bacterium]